MAVPAIDTLPDFSGQTLQLAVAQTDVKPSKMIMQYKPFHATRVGITTM
jgi:hypothetical protein